MKENTKYTSYYRAAIFLVTSSLFLVLIGFLLYGSTGRDDAHITYWPAYTLANMGHIINYNGEFVEQSSSLLHVILLASSHFLSGASMVVIGRLMSILFGVASLPVTYILSERIQPNSGPLAVVTTSVWGSYIYWAFGGLETTLAAFCVLWLILTLHTVLNNDPTSYLEWGHVLIATLAFITVRPEMPIVLGCVLTGTYVILALKGITKHTRYNFLVASIVLPLALLSVFLIRYYLFGSLLPLSVSAKSSGISFDKIFVGIKYILGLAFGIPENGSSIRRSGIGITPTGILLFILTSSMFYHTYSTIFHNKSDKSVIVTVCTTLLLAYFSFIILSGGDWMEAGRFIVPVIPIISVFISSFTYSTLDEYLRFVFAFIIVLISLSTNVNVSKYQNTGVSVANRDMYESSLSRYLEKENIKAKGYSWFERINRVNARDLVALEKIKSIIKNMDRDEEINILSGQMGMVMYYLKKKYVKRLKVIDKYNLTTDKVSKCKELSTDTRLVGSYASIDSIASKAPLREGSCNIDKPDIIYDINVGPNRIDGYYKIYEQEGSMLPGDLLFSGEKVLSDQTIFVKNDFNLDIVEKSLDKEYYIFPKK